MHRDIKPQNLLVDPGGFLKVMDFGIARLAEHRPAEGEALTAVGVVVGTPQYMAPEQLFGEPVDQRTDLFAAGAVLFECVTGRLAFDRPAWPSWGPLHLRGHRATRVAQRGRLAGASRIILRALATEPEDRWPERGRAASGARSGLSRSGGRRSDGVPGLANCTIL